MTRYITSLLFLFFFFAGHFSATAQIMNDVSFFTTVKKKKDKEYAFVLSPLIIDTLINYDLSPVSAKRWVNEWQEVQDTLQFDNAYFLKNKSDYKLIDHLGSLSKQTIEVQPAGEYLMPVEDCPRELLQEQKLKHPTLFYWKSSEEERGLVDFSTWQLDSIPEAYQEVNRWVLAYPCDPRSIEMPGVYSSFWVFEPNKSFSVKETKLVESITETTYVYTRMELVKRAIGQTKRLLINRDYLVVSNGGTKLVEVYSKSDLKKKTSEAKLKLKILGYFRGKTKKKVDDDFKQALLEYQIDHQLPMGQFDKKSMDHLLNN